MNNQPKQYQIKQFKIFLNTKETEEIIKDDKIVICYEKGKVLDQDTKLDIIGNDIIRTITPISIKTASALFFPFYEQVESSLTGSAWGDEPLNKESFSSTRCQAITEMLLKYNAFPESEKKFQEELEVFFRKHYINPTLPYLNI